MTLDYICSKSIRLVPIYKEPLAMDEIVLLNFSRLVGLAQIPGIDD